MKQQKNTLFRLIFFFLISISFSAHSQLVTVCQEDFHGVGEAEIECDDPIVITSTPTEGTDGTIISGLIYSEVSIRFISGYSKVRFVPSDIEDSLGRKRSEAGSGGKKGGRYSHPAIAKPEGIKLFPNPVESHLSISNSESRIVSYQVYSIDGRLLINESFKNSKTINLEQLKSGSHTLRLYLDNGEVINTHIIKQ